MSNFAKFINNPLLRYSMTLFIIAALSINIASPLKISFLGFAVILILEFFWLNIQLNKALSKAKSMEKHIEAIFQRLETIDLHRKKIEMEMKDFESERLQPLGRNLKQLNDDHDSILKVLMVTWTQVLTHKTPDDFKSEVQKVLKGKYPD